MGDPNPCSSSSPPAAGFALENDEISSILHTLLQSSSLPSSSFASLEASQQHQQPPEAAAAEDFRRQFCGSTAFADSAGMNRIIDSNSAFHFSFQGDCYAPGETDRSGSAFSGAIASSAEGVGDFDCESEKDQVASEVPRNPASVRNSSKRGRVAEFHNMSEKRRRQRINEKMKALQKLIPNSNKTDKASMLDEAIDYLKQLQLQVQMLALRNGSSLHPFYMPGLHSAHPTPTGICFNEEQGLPSSSRGAAAPLYPNQEIPMRNVYNPADQCASSSQKIFMPVNLDSGKSDRPFSLDPSTTAHCRPFGFTISNKHMNGDSKLQQLQLDVNRCGDESSSGVSS